MRRANALSFQPAEAGGTKNKTHTGCVPEKNTSMGRGRHCFRRRSSMDRAQVSYPEGYQFKSGRRHFLIWVPECVNTQEPATKARRGANDCTVRQFKYPIRTGSCKGACNELLKTGKENSNSQLFN